MDNRTEVRQFLATRRANITPEQAGLPLYGGQRRVPGLRRAEVAILAGISVEYYSRLERGSLKGVSDTVLDAIARALQLDDAEHAHLTDLARAANASPRATRRTRQQLRPALQHMLDAMTDAPAFIRNGRLDVLATNPLGHALYSPVFTNPAANRANLARFRFLDPQAAEFFPDAQESANTTVALLHTEAGRDPHNRELTDLVGELATRSDEFRTLWAAHNVRLHHTGIKHFRHPIVGELRMPFEAMPLPADPGLTMTIFNAEPETPAHDAIKLLASWAATLRQPQNIDTADRT